MSKRWVQMMIGITILGLFFGWIRHVDAKAEQDAQLLLRVAKPFMQSNEHITFKYTGYFGTCDGVNAKVMDAGERLSNKLGFQSYTNEPLSLNSSIYTVKSEVAGSAVATLTVASPLGQSACYAVLRVDAPGSADQDQLLKWQEQMTTQLIGQGIQGMWNVMIQGSAAEDLSLSNDPKEFLAELVQAYKGNVVERYEDGTTFSASLVSSEFEASIRSGNQKVNVQIALHLDTTSGLWRLTIGTPIITMEY
ncbi:YwmB family TATA-box binding protein [Paenibacillus qinlingensis]|uniref:YwmB family TATA-box binding protein n=1 Tax=Paenibacillus qinlingensis TaxID=1837343 RepID=UPI0015658D49|nr:YwmB family TATA-box binding protein [Paenibacillus qinlingensis]NQX64398.1 YwmB family TATA-box binding protein [Paenibacillus qinlingensis]